MNAGLSNYGNLTGDYIMQEQLSAGVELLGYGISIAKGGALGVLYTGVSLGLKERLIVE